MPIQGNRRTLKVIRYLLNEVILKHGICPPGESCSEKATAEMCAYCLLNHLENI